VVTYAIPPKARPIVVGNLFSRLVSKCAATLVAVDVWNYLKPLQLALSKKGSEARVHATRAYCKAHKGHRVVVLQLDFENAYNRVCCSHALHCLLEVAPGAAWYCYWKYAQPSRLAFGPYLLSSSEGTHQGDPMSSILFALAMHVLVMEVKEHWPALDSGAFMDDWDLSGNPEDADAAFWYILKCGPKVGCHLNPSKCCTIWLDGIDAVHLFPKVPQVLDGNFKCLKSPIGSAAFCQEVAEAVRTHGKAVLHAISWLSDLHAAYFLFKFCAGFPRMVYLMHTVPPTLIMEVLLKFDDAV